MTSRERSRIVAVLVVLLAAVAALHWRGPGIDAEDSPSSPAPPLPGPNPPSQAATARAVAPIDAPAARTPVERPPEPGAAPAAAPARVIGRCVAAESGAPLAGCSVQFSGFPSNSSEMARHGPVEWTDPEPVRTAEGGRFEIEFDPPPPYQHFLEVSCEGRVPRTARWGAFQPGQVADLGDVQLQRGYAVAGRVTDTVGAPVAGARISLENLPLPMGDGMAASNSRGGFSGADGRFAIEAPIPAGTWSCDAYVRGMKLVSPDAVTVREGTGAEPVAVVLKGMPSISGVVVDELGDPVPHVSVRAVLNRSGRMASAWTAKDGSFTLYAVDDELHPVRLEIDDPGPCEPPRCEGDEGPEYAWGSSKVRFELLRALSFELVVVDGASGQPVEEYSVQCYPRRSRSSRQTDFRLGGRHPGGRVTVDHVWRGSNYLVVRPNAPELVTNEPLEFVAEAAPLPEIRVELQRWARREVRVSTSEGHPVEGTQVEVFRPEDVEPDLESLEDPFGARVSSAATTDEHGTAWVVVPPEEERLGLFVNGKGHLPLIVPDVRFREDAPLELVVSLGGRLVGRLSEVAYGADQESLVLKGTRDGQDFWTEIPVRFDGGFELPSLAAGEYELSLRLGSVFRTEHGGSGSWTTLAPPLATALIRDGQTTKMEIDAELCSPAGLDGVVILDREDERGFRVFAERVEDSYRSQFGQYVPDESGRFQASGLPPGEYRLGLVVGDFKTSEGEILMDRETFRLSPGQTLERTFHIRWSRLTLHLLEPDGMTPIVDEDVILHAESSFRQLRTDGEGRIVLDPAPVDPFELSVKQFRAGPIVLPEDRMEVDQDVVLREH